MVTITDKLKKVEIATVMLATTTIGKLGITVKSGSSFVTYPVYSQMNASSAYKIGSVGCTSAREIVKVISSDTAINLRLSAMDDTLRWEPLTAHAPTHI